jgi:hypothetical protein
MQAISPGDIMMDTSTLAQSSLGQGITPSGKVGGAFNFDGMVYVRIPDAPLTLHPTHFTAEAWVFPTVPDSQQTILAHGDYGPVNGWDLRLENNQAQFWSHGGKNVVAPAAIPLNEWTHIAISFDGFAKRIYVNGIEAASVEESGALHYDAAPLTLGSEWSAVGAGAFFNGRIDEVALYDRALTADEILNIYNADFLGKTQPYILPPFQPPYGIVRTAYNHQLVTILGAPGPKTFSLSEGRLPLGANLSPTGLIGGTPLATGSFGFTVRATDVSGAFAEQVCLLEVLP